MKFKLTRPSEYCRQKQKGFYGIDRTVLDTMHNSSLTDYFCVLGYSCNCVFKFIFILVFVPNQLCRITSTRFMNGYWYELCMHNANHVNVYLYITLCILSVFSTCCIKIQIYYRRNERFCS